MSEHTRIPSKAFHGECIKEHGETIWNRTTPTEKLQNNITLFDHRLQATGELLTLYKAKRGCGDAQKACKQESAKYLK